MAVSYQVILDSSHDAY